MYCGEGDEVNILRRRGGAYKMGVFTIGPRLGILFSTLELFGK